MDNYGIEDIYKYYKSYSDNPVSEKIFVAAWKSFITQVTDGMVYEGRDFIMPFRLGPVGIRKQKIKVDNYINK